MMRMQVVALDGTQADKNHIIDAEGTTMGKTMRTI